MQGLKCKITDEIGKACRFHYFSFQLKPKWRSPRYFFFLPLPALVKIDPLLPLAKMERVVWCPDQSDGGNGDGAEMKWR